MAASTGLPRRLLSLQNHKIGSVIGNGVGIGGAKKGQLTLGSKTGNELSISPLWKLPGISVSIGKFKGQFIPFFCVSCDNVESILKPLLKPQKLSKVCRSSSDASDWLIKEVIFLSITSDGLFWKQSLRFPNSILKAFKMSLLWCRNSRIEIIFTNLPSEEPGRYRASNDHFLTGTDERDHPQNAEQEIPFPVLKITKLKKIK